MIRIPSRGMQLAHLKVNEAIGVPIHTDRCDDSLGELRGRKSEWPVSEAGGPGQVPGIR